MNGFPDLEDLTPLPAGWCFLGRSRRRRSDCAIASGEEASNGWFTEGFDTRDLQEAKVLFDDLQA
jgi:hypothetical protein